MTRAPRRRHDDRLRGIGRQNPLQAVHQSGQSVVGRRIDRDTGNINLAVLIDPHFHGNIAARLAARQLRGQGRLVFLRPPPKP